MRIGKQLAVCLAVVGVMVTAVVPVVGAAQQAGNRVDLCPSYADSDLYRARATQVTVGPDDNWEAELTNAAPGTEILLTDGTYQMTRYAVYLDNADITIRGASGNRDAVVIQGQGYGVGSEGLMVAAPRITIADLTMTAIRNHAISLKPAPSEGAEETHIYNVDLVDNGTQQIKGSNGGDNRGGVLACSSIGYTPGGVQGDYIGAIDLHSSSDWVIRDNYIYGVSGDGTGCEIDIDCGRYESSHPAILLWSNSTNITVERNVIVDSIRGITLGLGQGFDIGTVRNNFFYMPAGGDAGIELYDASNVIVEHNTILSPDYQGAIEYGGSPNAVIRNNLISAPPLDRPQRGASPGAVIEGNLPDATDADFAVVGQPALVAGSRAIGAGVATSLAIDIDGDARVGRWDVGADQVVSGSEPPTPGVNELRPTVTCLAGNGRVDLNIINDTDVAVTYVQRVGSLSPRQWTLEPKTSWRLPVTGRPDGPLRVVLERDGVVVLDETVQVRCDDAPATSEPEVQWFTWCIGGNGIVFAQLANPTAAARSYIVDVGGLRRSTTAAAYGATFRGVSGRPDGTHSAAVLVNGVSIAEATVAVDC